MYKTILADPPWDIGTMGVGRDTRPNRYYKIGSTIKAPYPVMKTEEIIKLPVGDLADIGCHLWLWTTNKTLEDGFKVMRAWGFKYLAPITWVKPSGIGAWFIHKTQTLLFGYKDRCIFNKERYKPTVVITGNPKRHSQKPDKFYGLIESISDEPRLELFARSKRFFWDVWGNEVVSDIDLKCSNERG